jgi:hypothetical protein
VDLGDKRMECGDWACLPTVWTDFSWLLGITPCENAEEYVLVFAVGLIELLFDINSLLMDIVIYFVISNAMRLNILISNLLYIQK